MEFYQKGVIVEEKKDSNTYDDDFVLLFDWLDAINKQQEHQNKLISQQTEFLSKINGKLNFFILIAILSILVSVVF